MTLKPPATSGICLMMQARTPHILLRLSWTVIVLFAVATAGASGNDAFQITGRTMGTTYQVTVTASDRSMLDALPGAIAHRLEQINRHLSTYLPDSDISRFNAMTQTGRIFCPSEDLKTVMAAAQRLFRVTGGAWDGTIRPLVTLWGFDRPRLTPRIPSHAAIGKVLDTVGFDRIALTDDGCLIKRNGQVTVDLASIAKGYGVDAIAQVVARSGFTDFLVEIGGEVVARGVRTDGRPWQVGINTPSQSAASDSVYRVIALTDRALATSGTYRSCFKKDGKTYSHILNPKTGYPIENGVVSVSVLAETCMDADGLATALMVMGPEKGIDCIESMAGVECLIVVRQPDGTLIDRLSSGFPP